MNRQFIYWRKPLCYCLFLYTLFLTSLSAVSTFHEIYFEKYENVIIIESIKWEERVFAVVRKNDDDGIDYYFTVSEKEEGVEVDKELAETIFHIDNGTSPSASKLLESGKLTSENADELFAKAEKEHEKYKQELNAKLNKDLANKGVTYDPEKEHLIFYYRGNATYTVKDSLQGDAKVGVEFNIT